MKITNKQTEARPGFKGLAITTLAAVFIAGLTVAQLATSTVQAEEKTDAPASKEAANYKRFCAGCHGLTGKGDTKLGKKMGARDYTDAQVKASLKDDAMFKGIKEGVKKDGKVLMHPIEDKLNDEEIKGLVAFMKAFK